MNTATQTKLTFQHALTQRMVDFIVALGIAVEQDNLTPGLLIPGTCIKNGVLHIDEQNLTYPGDILYQAGRIAILKPDERAQYQGEDYPDPMTEATQGMMAMCWAWAALMHLQIAPEVVFHEGGYKGQSRQIIDGFQSGVYMGLPMLQVYDMAYEPHQAAAKGLHAFPFMYKWINK